MFLTLVVTEHSDVKAEGPRRTIPRFRITVRDFSTDLRLSLAVTLLETVLQRFPCSLPLACLSHFFSILCPCPVIRLSQPVSQQSPSILSLSHLVPNNLRLHHPQLPLQSVLVDPQQSPSVLSLSQPVPDNLHPLPVSVKPKSVSAVPQQWPSVLSVASSQQSPFTPVCLSSFPTITVCPRPS